MKIKIYDTTSILVSIVGTSFIVDAIYNHTKPVESLICGCIIGVLMGVHLFINKL